MSEQSAEGFLHCYTDQFCALEEKNYVAEVLFGYVVKDVLAGPAADGLSKLGLNFLFIGTDPYIGAIFHFAEVTSIDITL